MSAASAPSVGQGAKSTSGPANATTNGNVVKRLQSELMTLMTQPTAGISAFPSGSDMTHWNATLQGPTETHYANKTFKLTLSYPNNYPYAPPEVLFKTPIYHPNVDFSGRICLDILKPGGSGKEEEGAWSAVMNTQTVLLSIQSLLGEPNKQTVTRAAGEDDDDDDDGRIRLANVSYSASPLNGEAALLWDSDKAEFKRKVDARHLEPAEMEEAA
ncbi:hypothetical protein D0864_05272 [Hortaea werneckii]|uniref:Ubiquitin-conjugating enzyme E2 2 n=1 Tax=Hortaea werneckii TaxID=91943 RepID=A0A3M7G3U5_HORWE|nr:hypothetical protein D0864_05272 [Hortaea werneckii]